MRPTSDRTRESLFNILAHGGWGPDGGSPVAGATVLDAFCGTGALGLEALSRGAAKALFLDRARASLDLARRNAEALGELASCRFVAGDATRPPAAPEACGLVFLDPPYREGLADRAVPALAAAGWFAAGAVVCVEVGAKDGFAVPAGFAVLDERGYGQAKIVLLRWGAAGLG